MRNKFENLKRLENLTGVVVHYRTPGLLKNAVDSIREFYDFPIVVIDGSGDAGLTGYNNVTTIKIGYNIGHGLGMDSGIKFAKTDFVLTFDTDIEMKEPCLELMLEKVKGDTYAIGKLYIDSPKQYFYIENKDLFDCDYTQTYVIHPSFQIVNKKAYLKYAPYISDGAPTVLSYHDIMRYGKEKEILIDFPVLDYVNHPNSGTRKIVRADTDYKDNTHWKFKWEKHIAANPI